MMKNKDVSESDSDDTKLSNFNWSDDNDSFCWSDESTEKNKIEKDPKETIETFSRESATEVWKRELNHFISALLKNVYLSDLVIHCNSGKIPAHRIILCRSRLIYSLLEPE